MSESSSSTPNEASLNSPEREDTPNRRGFATRLGAVDVLEKPTDIATLLEKIREARARHLAAKEARSQENVEDIMRRHGW